MEDDPIEDPETPATVQDHSSDTSTSLSSGSVLSRHIFNLEVRLRRLQEAFVHTQDTVSWLEDKIDNLQHQQRDVESDILALQVAVARLSERLGQVEEKLVLAEHNNNVLGREIEHRSAQQILQNIALANLSRRLAQVERILAAPPLN